MLNKLRIIQLIGECLHCHLYVVREIKPFSLQVFLEDFLLFFEKVHLEVGKKSYRVQVIRVN